MGYTQAEFFTMFIALFVILIVGVILKFVLGKQSLAVRQIPLHVIGASLLILEVIKQAYHIYMRNWHPWFLPLHFCSFFLVWYGVALFTRGKIRQLMYFCSLTGGFMVSVLLFAAPRLILHDAAHSVWDSFDHFHTFFYHMGMVAYWIYMLMLNIYQPNRQHIKKCTVLYACFYFVVIAGAFTFRTNYTDVLYSSLAALDNFRLSAGQFAYDILLLGFGIGSIAGVSYLTYFVTSKLYQRYLNKFNKSALAEQN